MSKKSKIRCGGLIYFVLLLAFCLASSLQAGTIIWVSDNKNPSGGVAADQGWVDLLEANGHTVDLSFRNQEGRTLDATKIAALNAADLIIISRDTDSGNYDDGDEPTQWNSIETPIIMQVAHIYRSSRWRWMDSTSTSSTTADMLAVLPGHPIFAGVALDANNQVSVVASDDIDVGDDNVDPTNNYTLIATRSDSGANGVWIAEWEQGVEFYPGSGQFAGGHRMYFAAGGGNPDGTYNLTAEGEKLFLNAVRYMLGETGGPGQASNPKPANEATDVPRDAVLSWTQGEFAPAINGHKVYISENFDDVNDGIGGLTQDANSYTPAQRLDFSTTYYWRIDEVNAPPTSTVYQGSVWSFTTEPVAYPIAGENITATASSTSQEGMEPENTINGSGLDVNDLHSAESTDMWLSGGEPNAWIEYELDKVHKLHEMWVWNQNGTMELMIGIGFKDVTIEYSVNGTDYTTLGTTHEFARAPGTSDYAHNTTIDFGSVTAKYVKLTANSNWGEGLLDQYGLSEVRFFSIPVFAREPSPDSGTTDVAVDVTLGFRAGREADKHDVYLSSDEQAVIDGNTPATTVTETSDGPLSLDLGTTYYWKINEVNEAETTTTWQGEIWNFSTHEFFVVDGFEDYNNYPPDEIWWTWVDGYGVPANGATSGYPDPDFLAGENYAETATVHGGDQSMPFFYSNTGTATYSEGERTFAVPQDWTKAGVQTLVLYLHGSPGNTGQLYVKVNGSKVLYDGDAADIVKVRWKQWNIDLASLGVDLQSVTTLTIGIDGSGAGGTLYLDDIRLYRLAPEIVVPSEEIWIEAEAADTITDPMLIYDDPLASGGKYIGTTDDVGNSSDNPPPDGIATYNFTVQGGTYKVSCRIIIPSGDSFWVRIPGATNLTPGEDPDNPGTGWVRWSDPPDSGNWYWYDVFSGDHANETANWTLAAGTHTLEIARREDGALLDVIVISKID